MQAEAGVEARRHRQQRRERSAGKRGPGRAGRWLPRHYKRKPLGRTDQASPSFQGLEEEARVIFSSKSLVSLQGGRRMVACDGAGLVTSVQPVKHEKKKKTKKGRGRSQETWRTAPLLPSRARSDTGGSGCDTSFPPLGRAAAPGTAFLVCPAPGTAQASSRGPSVPMDMHSIGLLLPRCPSAWPREGRAVQVAV